MKDIKNKQIDKKCKQIVEMAVEHAEIQLNWQNYDLSNYFVIFTIFVTLGLALGPILTNFAKGINTQPDALLFIIIVTTLLGTILGFIGFYGGKIDFFSKKKNNLIDITHWGRLILRFWDKTFSEEVELFFEKCLSEPKLINNKNFKYNDPSRYLMPKNVLPLIKNKIKEMLIEILFGGIIVLTFLIYIEPFSRITDPNDIIPIISYFFIGIITFAIASFNYCALLTPDDKQAKNIKKIGQGFLYSGILYLSGMFLLIVLLFLINILYKTELINTTSNLLNVFFWIPTIGLAVVFFILTNSAAYLIKSLFKLIQCVKPELN